MLISLERHLKYRSFVQKSSLSWKVACQWIQSLMEYGITEAGSCCLCRSQIGKGNWNFVIFTSVMMREIVSGLILSQSHAVTIWVQGLFIDHQWVQCVWQMHSGNLETTTKNKLQSQPLDMTNNNLFKPGCKCCYSDLRQLSTLNSQLKISNNVRSCQNAYYSFVSQVL